MAEEKVMKEELAASAPKKTPKARATKAKAAPKAKATPKAKTAPKTKETKPKAAALTKEDIQTAVYEAVKAAMLEAQAAKVEAGSEVKVEEVVEVAQPVVAEEPKKVLKKYVRSSDEKLMISLAIINLVLGVMGIIALVIFGFVEDANRDPYLEGPNFGMIASIVGLALLLIMLLQYACLKLFANISHRLSNIDKKC